MRFGNAIGRYRQPGAAPLAPVVAPPLIVSFAQQPTVSPASGSAGQVFTATPGIVNNGSVTSREWRQAGQVVSTGLTFPSSLAGAGTYQEFAGTVASGLVPFTVNAAAASPFFGSTSQTWGDNTTPVFGKVA